MNLLKSIDETRDESQFGVPLRTIEDRLGSDVVRIEFPGVRTDPVVRALDIYDAAGSDASGGVGGDGVLLCLISADAMRADELERALAAAAGNGCAGIAVKIAAGNAADSVLAQLIT